MLAFCRKICCPTQHLLLEFILNLDILVLEREPDLKSKMWLRIPSSPLLAIPRNSLSLPEPWFSHLYSGDSTCSAYLRLIVKVKWNGFLSLSGCVRVWILMAVPSWPLFSLASCGSLPSHPNLKIQEPWIHYRELTWHCLLSLPRYQLKKIHRKTRQPLFPPTHNC